MADSTVDLSLPRVSEILAVAGVLPDRTFLPDYALERGQRVHEYTEVYDKGNLDESDVDPAVEPYLKGWKNFRHIAGFQLLGIEERVQSDTMLYQGRLDRRVISATGARGVGEIKCGVPYPWHGLQLSGYCLALGPEYQSRWGFYLSPEYPLGFRVVEYRDRSEFGVFKGFASGYHWKRASGFEDIILEAVAQIKFGGERDGDPFSNA